MSKPNFTPYGSDTEAIAEARKYTQANGLRDPYRAYAAQRNSARIRGIGWEFTFASWWAIWQPYFHMRGVGTNDLCMARHEDEGPYAIENVYLTTKLGNSIDAHRTRKASEKRRLLKEEKEMRFARAGSASRFQHTDRTSHRTFKVHNSSMSTCNFKEDFVE